MNNFNFIKMGILSLKLIYRFNAIPIQMSSDLFATTDKLKFLWKFMRPRILKKKKERKKNLEIEKVGKLTNPNFKTYYKVQ